LDHRADHPRQWWVLLDSVTGPDTRGNRDQLEVLCHDRTLIRNALEEMMRFFAIAHIGSVAHTPTWALVKAGAAKRRSMDR
jgi:hypothetical protein